jgi:hypothetical protein
MQYVFDTMAPALAREAERIEREIDLRLAAPREETALKLRRNPA